METAGVAISYAYTEEVTKFLLERYQPVGMKNDIYFFNNNETAKATVGISLSVQDGYLLVMYVPANELPLKSAAADRSYEADFKAIFGKK